MKLQTTCKECKSEIVFHTWKTDRINLEMEKGKYIELRCKRCGITNKYHLNEIKAKESKVALIFGLLIFVLGTPILLLISWKISFQSMNIYFISGIIALIGIPLLIYTLIEKNEITKVRNFNNIKINE